jgi:hypothetical protein
MGRSYMFHSMESLKRVVSLVELSRKCEHLLAAVYHPGRGLKTLAYFDPPVITL